MFDEEDNQETNSNYPSDTDTAFTPDEVEAIKEYKANLKNKINKSRAVLKGLETTFWGITSYSLARFMILTAGTSGLAFAIASCLLINNITNRDCLDAFNFDRKDGQFEVSGMGKLIKFGVSTVITAFVIWGAVGDLLTLKDSSVRTYDNLQNAVEEFNKLPESKQKLWIVGGVLGTAALVVYATNKDK